MKKSAVIISALFLLLGVCLIAGCGTAHEINNEPVALIVLTAALVLATAVYAAFTFFLMRSQAKTQQSGSRPVIGIEAITVSGGPLVTGLASILKLEFDILNLTPAPALRIWVEAIVEFAGKEVTSEVLPADPIPFLTQDDEYLTVSCGLDISYDEICKYAKDTYRFVERETKEGTIAAPLWEEKGPFCEIKIHLSNQLGEKGLCASHYILKALISCNSFGGLEAVPINAEESLITSWESSRRTWFKCLFGSTS